MTQSDVKMSLLLQQKQHLKALRPQSVLEGNSGFSLSYSHSERHRGGDDSRAAFLYFGRWLGSSATRNKRACPPCFGLGNSEISSIT